MKAGIDFIYIVKFRNFRDQGFHFTNKYKYTVTKNGDKYFASRGNNPDYLDDFYGENLEICAVVGGNGVGKTSLMKAVLAGFAGYDLEKDDKFFLVFRNGVIKTYNIDSDVMHSSFKCDEDKVRKCFFHSNVLDYDSFSSPITDGEIVNISTGAILKSIVEKGHTFEDDTSKYSEQYVDPVSELFIREFKDQIQLVYGKNRPEMEWMTYPNYFNLTVKATPHSCKTT